MQRTVSGCHWLPLVHRLVLVDTLALMYRIHFGYGSKARLTTRHGDETVDTTIVYGMLDVIIRLMEIQPAPTHFAMVVDMAAKTWRCSAPIPLYAQFLNPAGQDRNPAWLSL